MCGGVRGKPPVELGVLAQRLEAYRRNRVGRSPLPEALWTEAARLAQRYGVCRVQQALRLSYYGLKQRLETLPTAVPNPSPAEPERLLPASVELGVPPSLLSSGTVLELEERTGARKLTVRLAREDSGALVGLARALWGGTP